MDRLKEGSVNLRSNRLTLVTRPGGGGAIDRPLLRRSLRRRTVLRVCSSVISAVLAWAAWPLVVQAASKQRIKWVAFYGQTADEALLASYDIVILDPMFEGSITAIAESGARVCGYLSLGEIRTTDAFYDRVDQAALLEENPAWPGTRRIDVRHRSWKELVLGQIIPAIVAKGFTGLMLDTLDTPPYLEALDHAGKAGMGQAAVDLVRAIHQTFPGMVVIMNRGYALLSGVTGSIDAIVAESLLTSPDLLSNPDRGSHGAYKWNEPSEVAAQLALLAMALRQQIKLQVLSLDYWDPRDTGTIEKIYDRERRLGHHPYVATPVLDQIIPEPA